ncbi:PAS domain S-box protein [Myxococcota bacterium]|nr:PAS domain S-box protein [Myxococcota bacterium]
MSAARRVAGIDLAGLYSIDAESGALVLIAHEGASDRFVEAISRYEATSTRVEALRALAARDEGTLAFSMETLEDVATAEGIRAAFLAPLRHAGELIGCLIVASRTVGELSPSMRDVIETVAVSTTEALVRARAVERARESDARHAWLFETMAQGVVHHEGTGRITAANTAACRILGLTMDELLSRTSIDPRWRALRADGSPFPGEEHPAMIALRTGEIVRDVAMGIWDPRRGEQRWISIDAFPTIPEGGGAPTGVYAVFTDVTERHVAERALREHVARFEALVAASLDGFAVLDPGGRVRETNAVFRRMFGLIDAHGPLDITVLGVRGEAGAWLVHVRERGWARAEVTLTRLDGTSIDVEVSAWLLPAHVEVMTFFRDLTERRTVESALQKSQELLVHSQKMEAIGRLAGGVAHDFNNLLTVINGSAGLALSQLDAASSAREDLDEILRAGARAAGLTRQLLTFSRRQVVQPKLLDLARLVSEIERMLHRLIGEDVLLEVSLGPGVPPVFADAGQLEQVIVNLAVNARDAMPRGGRLTIEVRDVSVAEPGATVPPGRYAVLSVNDTGSGMDAETMAHIFEPFFTTKGRRGTGLGLSTVYGVVEQAHGHIRVRSIVGQGSRFDVYLPAATGVADDHEKRRARAVPHSAGETVLLVEDEPRVREIVRQILGTSGYVVLVASSGEEALALAAAHEGPIHALLTDLVMPGMDGRTLAARLVEARPSLKVLFSSGYSDEALARRGVTDFGGHFVAKPFDIAGLRAKLRDVLDSAGPERGGT